MHMTGESNFSGLVGRILTRVFTPVLNGALNSFGGPGDPWTSPTQICARNQFIGSSDKICV